MDAYDCIITKLDVREFAPKHVPADVKLKVMEAARMTGSSRNSQHWRFILIQDRGNLSRLAQDSVTGKWVEGADFAVVILVDPKVGGSHVDGGRVLQDMELAAWNFGVVSRLYTGVNEEEMRRDFGVPDGMVVSAVLGFGYPTKKVRGRKERKPLEDLVSTERYGNRLTPSAVK